MTTIQNIIIGQTAITTAITGLAGKKADLIESVNTALYSAINHVHVHGDVTVLNGLVTVFSDKSDNKRAIMAMIKSFSPAKWNEEDKAFKLDKKGRIDEFLASDKGIKLLETSFEGYKKETKPTAEKEYNSSVMTFDAIKNLEKNFEKQGVILEGAALEALNALKEAVKEQAVEFTLAQAAKADRVKALKKFS